MKTIFINSLLAIILWCLIPLPHLNAEIIHFNKGRGYSPFKYATGEGIEISNKKADNITDGIQITEPSEDFVIYFRASNLNSNPSKRNEYFSSDKKVHYTTNPEWGLYCIDTDGDSIIFRFRMEEKESRIESEGGLAVRVFKGGKEVSRPVIITEGINPYTGINNWELSLNSDAISLKGGSRKLQDIIKVKGEFKNIKEIGYISFPGSRLSVTDISLDLNPGKGSGFFPEYADYDFLDKRFKISEDPLEGYWVVFDRELEESLLKMGGDYKMALVKEDEKYLLIYLEGARVNSSLWKAGKVKGILHPSHFKGIYEATWIDSQGLPLSHEIKAQEGEGGTLTFSFPYQSSTIRLRKIESR